RACEGRPMSPVSPARPQNVGERAAQILARVAAPTFADRVLDITDFGAVGDGTTDCTAALAAAIEACSSAGGGRVLVPAGRYHTGAVHLLDDVDLHLADGAVLAFSQDPDDYLPPVRTRSEEHTSELQSRFDLVCRLLLEKKNIDSSHFQAYLMHATIYFDTNLNT